MGKTIRNAGHWFENKIKNKDQSELGNLWWDYTNPRCVQRLRKKNNTFYTQKLDPRTLKPLGWKEYDSDYKAKSKRNARRAAKILFKIEAYIIMQEVWDDYWADMWSICEEDDWYENHSFVQNWEKDSYWEDYDYQYGYDEKMEESQFLDYGYDPYIDWEY